MTERVNTGGTVSFVYPKGYQPEADEETGRKIDESYAKHYARKRRNNWIKLGVVVLIVLVVGGYLILR